MRLAFRLTIQVLTLVFVCRPKTGTLIASPWAHADTRKVWSKAENSHRKWARQLWQMQTSCHEDRPISSCAAASGEIKVHQFYLKNSKHMQKTLNANRKFYLLRFSHAIRSIVKERLNKMKFYLIFQDKTNSFSISRRLLHISRPDIMKCHSNIRRLNLKCRKSLAINPWEFLMMIISLRWWAYALGAGKWGADGWNPFSSAMYVTV